MPCPDQPRYRGRDEVLASGWARAECGCEGDCRCDVSPRRTKRHGQDGRSCRIRCVMSHVVGPVPQSQTCYTLSCHVPTVCARHVVTCAGGLHVRASVSPPHHEHGGGGESWAQPSAPTVMLLLPKSHPPNTYTQPCTTHPHLKICVESLFHPPALLGSLGETAAFLKREGFSQRCPLVPPSHCLTAQVTGR